MADMFDRNRPDYAWLNPIAREFLSLDYLVGGQSPEDRIAFMGATAERVLNKPGFAAAFQTYAARGYYSFASPVWTNFGLTRGLPISCYGSCLTDDMPSILSTHAEIGMMSKYGGGTSVYMGAVRGRGSEIRDNGTLCGSVHFAELYDHVTRTVSQGSSRRGECAAYWPITHADVREVLRIRTTGHPIQKLSYALCVPDAWMEEMIAGDAAKRELWAAVLMARQTTGYPYLFFSDTVNRAAPPEYADLGLTINHSNLCTEVALSNSAAESFVCCLSSMNDLYFDEWRDTDAVEVLVYFLDAVMTEFIEKARGKYGMDRAVAFAERQRALGIGQLGWHTLLQMKMLSMDDPRAGQLNVLLARTIRDRANAASARMAEEYGEPPYLKGRGRRHMTLTAIAPTKSSSAILGQVSESIAPYTDNYGIKDLQKLKYTFRNPLLEKLLDRKGLDVGGIMKTVLKRGGSVQHLTRELTDNERAVFKTFPEVAPMDLVRLAAQRQPYIDQSQSLNLWIDPQVPVKEVNQLIISAWRAGVKTLYYQLNVNAAQQLTRSLTACSSCES
jgi:ribonucleoside-diphosphate reductase alpha chain